MNTPSPLPNTLPVTSSSAEQGTAQFELTEPVPVRVGKYTLLTKLGEGGMGSVWAARQQEPVKRDVALKLIRPGMDSSSVLARFEQERQALAVMDHPNIAKVFDGGVTAEGQPYFAMELVRGPTLNIFCDQQQLNITGRLELFVKICQAVQHAHQKGIIHRDLKPANILVIDVDGQPVPKIIDFGVAKAIAGKLIDGTLTTQLGNVIGTLEYMAPEQAGTTTEDIDTRADVYSLGVILYELLTGLRPFDGQRLRQAALLEAIRIIREEEPSKPSTRVSTSESLPSIAAVRQMEPGMLTRSIQGDLDWIVMKALEKNRNRRYETASAFAMDILHYLADEPVSASPPSVWYRVRKFTRRHRAAVLAASLIAVALLLGLAGTSWGYVQARQERDEKDEARKIAIKERDDKEQARAAAVAQGKQAVAVASLLESLFSQLNPAGASAKQGLKENLLLQLKSALTDLDSRYAGEPLVKARLQRAIGVSLLGLGESLQAEKALLPALQTYEVDAANKNEAAATLYQLGLVQQITGRYSQAAQSLEKAYQVRLQALGPSHMDTLQIAQSLASLYIDQDRLPESIKLLNDVYLARRMTLGEQHQETLHVLTYLGDAHVMGKQYEQGIRYLEQSYRGQIGVLPPEHPSLLKTIDSLASAYTDVDKNAEAVKLLQQTLQLTLDKFGPNHPNTIMSDGNLARARLANHEEVEALKSFERIRTQSLRYNGVDHPVTLILQGNMAAGYRQVGQAQKAITLLEPIREPFTNHFGTHHVSTLSMLQQLASSYYDVQRNQDAADVFEIVLQRRLVKYGRQHESTLTILNMLATAYARLNRLDDAIRMQHEVFLERKKTLGMGQLLTQNALDHLAMAQQDAGKHADSVNSWRELLTAQRNQPMTAKATDPSQLRSLLGLSFNLLKTRQYVEAEPYLREVLTYRLKHEPEDWRTFNTQVMLGESLLNQSKSNEAKTHLVSGYEGMKARLNKVPAEVRQTRLGHALDLLIKLHREQNQQEEQKKWEAEKTWLKGQ